MSLLEDILEYNQHFVEEKKYEQFARPKYPQKKMVILSCMDTRLVELLPKALNLSNGDVKLIKNAGALVSHPFGSIMRSILVAVYQLQAHEVMVVGHHDCGMCGMKSGDVIEKMIDRGIDADILNTLNNSGIDIHQWLHGFDNVKESVAHSVDMIRNHPLFPKNVPVHGLVINPDTGKLDLVINGYDH
ncbi:beta-class carbonic anhydrase [Cytobacillus sp. Hz8]|uniref:beta-class carbonic anhydrase n=1 Tax=Cytobacillus sp. Hz8 TaxID=3347168 RepID=UPI0035E33D47